MTILIIIAILLLLSYIAFMSTMGLWLYPLILLGVAAAMFVATLITVAIRKSQADHPVFSARQKLALDEAKREDARITAENDRQLRIAQAECNKNRQNVEAGSAAAIKKLQIDADACTHVIQNHTEKLNSMGALHADEKNLEVINWLIYFMETHRADSIKEALHEYDKALVNQQLFMLEQQKLELQRAKAANEQADRQRQLEMEAERQEMDRRHQFEVESRLDEQTRLKEHMSRDLGIVAREEIFRNS